MHGRWGALSAMAFAALLVGGCASAFDTDVGPEVGRDPLFLCRENMTTPSATVKVGPLRLLSGAIVQGRGSSGFSAAKKPVPWSNVRIYAARQTYASGYQSHELCFLEKTGNTYRLVQICAADAQLWKVHGCDISWITGQPSPNQMLD